MAIVEHFLELAVPAVRQAAGIARALEGQVANRPKAGEATPVKAALTIADSAAQEAILAPLADGIPSVMLRAEEDTPSVARFAREGDHLVVVDPIDGTLHAYLEGSGPYSVMTGLAAEGRYRASVIALPREDLLVYGRLGEPVAVESLSLNGAGEREEPSGLRAAAGEAAPGRDVLVSQGVSQGTIERLRAADYNPRFGSGGAIAIAPLLDGVCAGIRVSRGPEGVSIRGRIGVMLARSAGCAVAGEEGEFPDDLWSRSETLLVSRDDEGIASLRAALRE
jgi:fructose-1,6-bisphosphatase/inositol monophosphatase family enzyme